jgi:hypothetical protein
MFEYCVYLSCGSASKLSPQIKSYLNFKYDILNKNEILSEKSEVIEKYGKQSFIGRATEILIKVKKNILTFDDIHRRTYDSCSKLRNFFNSNVFSNDVRITLVYIYT